MKKNTAKEKNNKVKSKEAPLAGVVGLEEVTPEESPLAAELDPEILKVFVKPKKSKNIVDSNDYIPELERGDTDEEFGTDNAGF